MTPSVEMRIPRILASIEKSFAKFDKDFAEALARLDETTSRITALGEIHLRLATTLMDALHIIPLEEADMPLLSAQVGVISSTERAELMASGLLRPVIRSLRNPLGEIAEAIRISEKRILEAVNAFDVTEMDILATEFSRNPEGVLGSNEQEACRDKVREWVQRLKDVFSESEK